MKEILSISIPALSPPRVVGTLVAACFTNISLRDRKLSVNCCDDRSVRSVRTRPLWFRVKADSHRGAFTAEVRAGGGAWGGVHPVTFLFQGKQRKHLLKDL